MRRLSLNKRVAYQAESTEEVDVFLFYITHPDLDEPIRLSTDPTERLTADPLAYGTRSTWMGSNPITEPFLFVIASALAPSDISEAPTEAQMSLQIVDDGMAEAIRSFTQKPTVNLAHVLASSPNTIEGEWSELKLNSADMQFQNGEIVLSFSRDDEEEEPHAIETFSKENFPGLHR